MTTDIHTHLGMSQNEMLNVNFDNLEEHVDMLISRMDTFGIDRAVLTPHEPKVSTDMYLTAIRGKYPWAAARWISTHWNQPGVS